MAIVIVLSSGVHISATYPYLGASPDGAVYDPINIHERFGFLEVKVSLSSKRLYTSGSLCNLRILLFC